MSSVDMMYVFALMTIKMRAMNVVVQTRELFVTCLRKITKAKPFGVLASIVIVISIKSFLVNFKMTHG